MLSIDPSLRATGYAVLEQTAPNRVRALAYGTLRLRASLRPSACLVEIHRSLNDLIERLQPRECAVEGVIYVQSHRTAIALGAARGVAILAAAAHGLEVYEYAPRAVKLSVVGRGGAQKEQVAFMVRALLGLTETPDPDAADALAIGLTHLRQRTSPLSGAREPL